VNINTSLRGGTTKQSKSQVEIATSRLTAGSRPPTGRQAMTCYYQLQPAN